MRVVSIAAECEPWAKTGGLGDVVDALARALGRLPGGPDRPTEVFLPRYRSVPVPADARDGGRVSVADPRARGRRTTVRLLEVAADGYRLRLVDHPAAFDRAAFYDEPDDGWRFGLFGRATLEALRSDVAAGGRPPDVLHIHDWHTGPVAIARDRWYADDPVIGPAAIVLTLHNLAYHGWQPLAALAGLGLAPSDGIVEPDADGLDLLATGIRRADLVNTVSPTYAREALTPAFGFGLMDELAAKGDRFTGILNGLDTGVWDPATDAVLAAAYRRGDPAGKSACRRDLLRRLGMDPLDDDIVVGAVGRLDPQKGFDLIVEAAPAILAGGGRIVVQASGDPGIATGLRRLTVAYPGRVAFVERFDREMARRIYAGVDALLVPSRFEPSGQVQMIAMRYGTPPIAHATGGLVDSIIDEHDRPGEGTGILFRHPTATGLTWAVAEAARLRGDGTAPAWLGLVDRAMAADFAWERGAAPAYVELYERAVALRRSALGAGPRSSRPGGSAGGSVGRRRS
jgi:starch synthase